MIAWVAKMRESRKKMTTLACQATVPFSHCAPSGALGSVEVKRSRVAFANVCVCAMAKRNVT